MDKRRCVACRGVFTVRAQTPGQRYCSAPACQRARRRRWQREKRRTDPDYRENQHQAQQRWAARQGAGYWRRYRAEHPEYTAANRAGQRERAPRAAPDRRHPISNSCARGGSLPVSESGSIPVSAQAAATGARHRDLSRSAASRQSATPHDSSL